MKTRGNNQNVTKFNTKGTITNPEILFNKQIEVNNCQDKKYTVKIEN